MSAVRLAYPTPASCRVFKSGSTYVAQTIEGKILSTSSTDASVVINAAIVGIPGAAARGFGGRVFIHAGDYTCLTNIVANRETLNYDGVSLMGEGIGTRLIFEPTGALTDGITFRMLYPQLKDMLIWAKNANLTNLVAGRGPTVGTGQYNWGVVENVSFNGPNSGIPVRSASTIVPVANPQVVFPTPGQTGLALIGNGTNSFFTANWKTHNCEYFALDKGMRVVGQYGDMSHHDNLHCGSCNIGLEMQGVQHNLSNVRIEGGGGHNATAIGSIGIWLRDSEVVGQAGGNIHMMSNINIELHKLDAVGILADISTNNNMVSNLYNSSTDDMLNHTWVDNNFTTGVNTMREAMIMNIANSRARYGQCHFGLNRAGDDHGIFRGNIFRQLDGIASEFSTSATINGPMLNLTTGTGLNSVACIFYNNSLGNRIVPDQYPTMYVRFWPNSLTNIRMFMGICDHFAAPAASADVLANKSGFGLYLDTSVSPNFKIMHNDGDATSSIADFPTFTLGDRTYGPTAISAGYIHSVGMKFNNSNPSANVRLYGLSYDYKTTEIPLAGTPIGYLIYLQNLTAGASRSVRLFDMESMIITI